MSELYTSIDKLLSSGSRLDTLAGPKLCLSNNQDDPVGQVNFLSSLDCDFDISLSHLISILFNL